MVSLDQVLLLKNKVENAVAKIAQLNAENAALRRKCAELTNALSAKTEQFSSFQEDQDKIEEGILKALERLDSVENTVHSSALHTEEKPVLQTVSSVPHDSDIKFQNVSIESFDSVSSEKETFSGEAQKNPPVKSEEPFITAQNNSETGYSSPSVENKNISSAENIPLENTTPQSESESQQPLFPIF